MIKIVAEIGINHCGRFADALDLIDAAAEAGADSVKFQMYRTALLARDIPNRDLLKSCELTTEEYGECKRHAEGKGLAWFASCFEKDSVDEALSLGVGTIKLGSGEIVNHELVRYIGMRGAKLMLSTGMSTIDDICQAILAWGSWSRAELRYQRVSLLHCVSNYPTQPKHCNLRAIHTLKRNFNCPVGFSDHSVGFDAAIGAVAVGADIIERHLMLRPGCPDERVSLSPENFRGYVATIRRAEEMMGDGEKRLMPGEEQMQKLSRYRWHKEVK